MPAVRADVRGRTKNTNCPGRLVREHTQETGEGGLQHRPGSSRMARGGLFLDTGMVGQASSGALTDRPRDAFRIAAAQQLATGGAQTHRTTYGGKMLHSPRDRDLGALVGEAQAYRAPGSPRNQVEMFYIRHNQRGPKEVRLIARRERAASFFQSPSFVNATLAQTSPRSSFDDPAGSRARRELVAVGPVTDWKAGWRRDGSRLPGEGVKWSGRPRKEWGDTATFAAEAPVPLLSPLAGNTSTLWQRGGAQQRKTPPPMSASPDAEGMRSPAESLAESVTRSPIGNTKWPRPGGSPWKSFVKQVKKRNQTYEDHAEHTFGHAGAGMTQPSKLHKRNEMLTRIPRQWLHTRLTDINITACRLHSLPSSFGDYAFNTTSLMLEHNQLSSLPDSIAKMSKLRFLGECSDAVATYSTPRASCAFFLPTTAHTWSWDCADQCGLCMSQDSLPINLTHFPMSSGNVLRSRCAAGAYAFDTDHCPFAVCLCCTTRHRLIELRGPALSDVRSVHRCSRCNATSCRRSRLRLATAENCVHFISRTIRSRSWRCL